MPIRDKIVSFSIHPEDKQGRKAVEDLKRFCEENSKIFSRLIIQAIKEYNEKLLNHDTAK